MNEEGKFSAPELELVLNNSGNEVCCDCKGKNPYWSSINNGVLLCAKCTRKHRKYGNRISKIKSLEVDKWDKREILFLQLGGNLRFNKLMSEYNIPLTKNNQEYKYYTKIADYYRKLLEEETKGNSINIEKPSLKEGIQKIDLNEDNINYQNNNENTTNNSNHQNNNINYNNSNYQNINQIYNNNNYYIDEVERNKEDNLKNNWNDFVFSMSSFINNVGNKIQKKVKDYHIDEKINSTTNYLSNKKDEVTNSEIFQSISQKAANGINTVKRKANELINGNNNNTLENYSNINENNQTSVQFNNNNLQYEMSGIQSNNSNINYNNMNNSNNDNHFNMNNNNNININSYTENISKDLSPNKPKLEETSLDD